MSLYRKQVHGLGPVYGHDATSEASRDRSYQMREVLARAAHLCLSLPRERHHHFQEGLGTSVVLSWWNEDNKVPCKEDGVMTAEHRRQVWCPGRGKSFSRSSGEKYRTSWRIEIWMIGMMPPPSSSGAGSERLPEMRGVTKQGRREDFHDFTVRMLVYSLDWDVFIKWSILPVLLCMLTVLWDWLPCMMVVWQW